MQMGAARHRWASPSPPRQRRAEAHCGQACFRPPSARLLPSRDEHIVIGAKAGSGARLVGTRTQQGDAHDLQLDPVGGGQA
eukprot:3100289-Prymnesium_polylepis.1